LRALLVQHFNRDGAILNVEFRANRRDGGILELSITGYVGRDEQGSVLYYEGVIQDVTARKRVAELKIGKEAAEAAARAKGEFLANMSHEIRTPMTAILGFTTLALKREVPPKVKDYLQKIDAAGQSLLGVINDILDFSKMDAGKLELEAIPFNLNEVLLRVRDLFAEQARAKGISLLVAAEQGMPDFVVGDPSRLAQILVNLVSNAVKFTKEGEVALEVSVHERRDDEVLLSFEVRDTGIGMAQAQIDRLFQAFSQADTSTTRHYGGTGLGLTISKNLTELMGGNITIASEPGVGTIFVVMVTFPVAATASAPQAFVSPAQSTGEVRLARHTRILLVEDNTINQQVATELLISAGYSVEVANNGVEAVHMAEAQQYDAILMDIQMPEMDGYEATRRLREGMRQPNVPIIAMTAHAIAGYREQCLARGMNDYITKPISPAELYRTLARWCTQGISEQMTTATPTLTSSALDGGNDELQQFSGLAPLIEVSEVWRHVGGKSGLLRRLLERFVQSGQSSDEVLRAALQDGDMETVQRIVHTTKGMAGTLAAADLRNLAMALEAALEQDGIAASAELQQQYFEAGARLRDHIAAFLGA
jgi:signal transduction histidine kinase/HPt (histidine-containing phosphotransfer) domain-containing protein/ActR/RegA family two-component response regulator